MKSSINVYVRVKPSDENETGCLKIDNNTTITLTNPTNYTKHQYTFNNIFDQTATQEDIFDKIQPSIDMSIKSGYNSCIFAYGQTGCFGKGTRILLHNRQYINVENITKKHTLVGPDESKRNIIQLYRGIDDCYQVSDYNNDNNIKDKYRSYVVNSSHMMSFYDEKEDTIKDIPLMYFLSNHYRENLIRPRYFCLTTRIIEGDTYQINKYEIRKIIKYLNSPNIVRDVSQIRSYLLLIRESDINTRNRFYKQLKRYAHRTNIIDNKFKLNDDNDKLLYLDIKNIGDILYIILDILQSIGCQSYIVRNKIYFSLTLYHNQYYLPRITYVGKREYYGFEVDGDNRFIGAGYNILHNSGKTHTMLGNSSPGLIPNICRYIFSIQNIISVELSFIEIYSEKIYDLLTSASARSGKSDTLTIKMANNETIIDGLSQLRVYDSGSALSYINGCIQKRITSQTKMNDTSSRSHAIVIFNITSKVDDGTETIYTSKLNLVDLAGSERINKSGSSAGTSLKEATDINKSLSVLNKVLITLNNKTSLPPYRDSVLTSILKESLGGNSVTIMISTLNPSSKHYDETHNTLRYANIASKVVNIVRSNEKCDTNEKMILKLKRDIESMKNIPNTNNTQMQNNTLNEQIKKLQDDLAEKEKIMKSMQDEIRKKTDEMNEKDIKYYSKLSIDINKLAQENIFLRDQLVEKSRITTETTKNFLADRATLTNKILSLTSTISSQQHQIDELQKQVSVFASNNPNTNNTTLTPITNLIEQEEIRYTELSEKNTILSKEVEESTEKLNELNIKYEQLKSSYDIDHASLLNMRDEQQQLSQKMNNTMNEYIELQIKKEEITTEITKIQAILDECLTHAKSIYEHSSETTFTQENINTIISDIDRLTSLYKR